MNVFEELRNEVHSFSEKFSGFQDYDLSDCDYDEFRRNGNRLNFEEKYFAKRACLAARALNSYITSKKADSDLVMIIESICDEKSWVLPAHAQKHGEIDLFSSMTAQSLCEISHYIQLPENLSKRIHDLIKEKIKIPYESKEYPWEEYTNNWQSICAGCLGMMYLYEFPEDFPKVKSRILKSMRIYIDNYGDDGACTEGMGYWEFGFGYFLFFAEMLRRIEGTDILDDEKIKKIAEFQQNMFLRNDITASFSDTQKQRISYDIGMACFMQKEFGDNIRLPHLCYRSKRDGGRDWALLFRSLLWFDEDILKAGSFVGDGEEEKYFENAQWYINKKKRYSFAAKAGNNWEFHNHNDVGAFIITDGKTQLITDYGSGEYTKDYFDPEKRYDIFLCSSAGHSVPIIDNTYQSVGEKYKSTVLIAENNKFVFEMCDAYEITELTSLMRSFTINNDSVVLKDSYVFSEGEHKIVERFISMLEPIQENGVIIVGDMKIKSDEQALISCETVKNHQGQDVKLYLIDFQVNKNEFMCTFTF